MEHRIAEIWSMCGQGYRNKAERKSNSRFVVSEKNKPGYGQKKRADTPKMQSESQVVVDVRSISQSPRRLRAKYTHRTNQRFVLRIFRPAGSCSADRRIVRKRMPMHPLTNDMAEFILPRNRNCRYLSVAVFILQQRKSEKIIRKHRK